MKKISKKKEVPKSIVPKRNGKKTNYRFLDEYKDLFTKRLVPAPIEFIELLTKQIINWAYNDKKALFLDQFWFSKGIPTATFRDWRKRFPELDEACQEAKLMIGMRRETGAINRKFEPGMIRAVQPMYRPEWKELIEWNSNLKQKADEKTQNNTIQWVLEKFPDSNIVPKKDKS